ncbi:hypothetical protein EW145_g5431 [Phellinidium pouzarii]|uniref:Transmembrane protein n=1 Tax=Phellinidium pouzarii TaxID=167371 RepID=A0A4S4L1B5_9AGAM|nr:hypothetical protein EW145_g5431 [Phellinidium pouzarii]
MPDGSFGFDSPSTGDAPLLLAIPARIWRLYVEYLCSAQPGTWVASVTSMFQLLACLVIAPFAILSLLDVMSYIIARTLGVVETTKASTSDKLASDAYDSDGTLSETEEMPGGRLVYPSVHVTPASSGHATGHGVDAEEEQSRDADAAPTPSLSVRGGFKSRFSETIPMPGAQVLPVLGEPEACFFSPSDEKNLELSGALLSSPALSRRGSPTLERRQSLRGDLNTTASSNSESFTMLGKDSEADEASSLSSLRKRGGAIVSNDASVSYGRNDHQSF